MSLAADAPPHHKPMAGVKPIARKYDKSDVFLLQVMNGHHVIMHVYRPANCEDALNIDGQMDIGETTACISAGRCFLPVYTSR